MRLIPLPTMTLAEMATDPKRRSYSWEQLVRMIESPLQYLTDDEYDAAQARLDADRTDLFTDGQHFYTVGTYHDKGWEWALFGVRMGKLGKAAPVSAAA